MEFGFVSMPSQPPERGLRQFRLVGRPRRVTECYRLGHLRGLWIAPRPGRRNRLGDDE